MFVKDQVLEMGWNSEGCKHFLLWKDASQQGQKIYAGVGQFMITMNFPSAVGFSAIFPAVFVTERGKISQEFICLIFLCKLKAQSTLQNKYFPLKNTKLKVPKHILYNINQHDLCWFIKSCLKERYLNMSSKTWQSRGQMQLRRFHCWELSNGLCPLCHKSIFLNQL